MARVVVEPSVILVNFQGSQDGPLELWMPRRPAVRTHAEASLLAGRLVDELRAHRASFEDYARRYSDDEASSSHGGALGAQRATQLPMPYVQALAAIAPGEISNPVDTAFGVAIFTRAVPATGVQPISARQILIPWGGALGARSEIVHTRAEAFELATSTVARLRANPEAFLETAKQLSADPRGAVDADWGSWTPYEPFTNPLAVHVGTQLPIGGISDPIDTRTGFLILQRDARSARRTLSASVIQLSPRASRRGTPDRELKRLLEQLTRNPTIFDEMRSRRCTSAPCESPVLTWNEGRIPWVALERSVLAMSIGQISESPVTIEGADFIVRRNAAEERQSQGDYRTDFPDTSPWSLEQYVVRLNPNRTAVFVGQLRDHVIAHLELTQQQAESVSVILDEFAASLPESRPQERLGRFNDTNARMYGALGHTTFALYQAEVERWFESMTKL